VTELTEPIVRVNMLIRRPVEEVFQAFIDPAVTTQFWFTKSSGKLEPGKRVRWDWEMLGVHSDVEVKEIETNKQILIEWSSYIGRTPVEWLFEPRSDQTTMVTISNWGFHGDQEQVVRQALDATQGFTFLIAGLKAFLEHGVRLNFSADKCPDKVAERQAEHVD
jgi:uncharacterized protein YndB with AHSA1/START domain